jgi:hypothetical protein
MDHFKQENNVFGTADHIVHIRRVQQAVLTYDGALFSLFNTHCDEFKL